MTVEYNTEVEEQILSHLDGWVAYNDDSNDSDNSADPITNDIAIGEVQPFIESITEYADNPNKKVSSSEIEQFYDVALNKAYVHCNRLNVEDLNEVEEEIFVKGVCLLTASDLWNKYNIRVNNEDMEDTYVQSYGGLLYKQAINILNSFINQRVTTLTCIKKKRNEQNNDNIWII